MRKKIKEYIPSKWLYVLAFLLPTLFAMLMLNKMDNDMWYLLTEGRHITEFGIYYIDPLSMHQGLSVVVQNWLSASIFWLVFKYLGEMGIFTLVIIVNFFICFLLYKICVTISDNNRVLSLLIMFVTDITLATHFIVTRPQIFSFLILLGVIYVLELYIKTNNWHYLIWLPVLSLIEANLHASLWWMIFLFSLPYIIDAFKIPFLNTQGYPKKPLFIFLGIAFVAGLINPYGYKIITFIFTSFSDTVMHKFIRELLPFSLSDYMSYHMFFLGLLIFLLYAYFRSGNVRIRYLCLFAGTLLLSFISIKGFSHFILVSIFPFAYFFSSMFPKEFELDKETKKVLNIALFVTSIVFMVIALIIYVKAFTNFKMTNNAQEAVDIIEKYGNKDTDTIYTAFNDGGYVEYRGFKAYIDPRAEVFLKSNNGVADILAEDYNLQMNNPDIKTFLDKYKFTFLLLNNTDYLYGKMYNQYDYTLVYYSSDKGFSLYVRNDAFSDEVINAMKSENS